MTIAFGGVDLPSIKPEAIFAIHLFLRAWWCVKVSRAEKANFLIYYRITLLPQSKNVIFRWNMELLHTQKSIWSSVNRIVSCIFFKCLWLVWASSSAASRGSHRFNRLVIFSHGKNKFLPKESSCAQIPQNAWRCVNIVQVFSVTVRWKEIHTSHQKLKQQF